MAASAAAFEVYLPINLYCDPVGCVVMMTQPPFPPFIVLSNMMKLVSTAKTEVEKPTITPLR